MNTPAHVIFAAVALARPHDRRRTIAAVAGALAPDLSLYLMVAVSLFVLGISPRVVFDELYFSNAWQAVFSVDNSFFVWGAVFGLAWRVGARNGMVFAAAGLLHLALDFPLHHDDGRPHFWPLTKWVFQSPLSYWDRAHHAGLVGPVEMALSALFCAILMVRYDSIRSRVMITGLAAAQLFPLFIWAWVFAVGG